uniref:Uncharacterized protein n=1 Tax=Arundo donax TaxID=35708 RepID=A0A0A9CMT6_ARUDO
MHLGFHSFGAFLRMSRFKLLSTIIASYILEAASPSTSVQFELSVGCQAYMRYLWTWWC